MRSTSVIPRGLRHLARHVSAYVWSLEEAMIGTAAHFGVPAERRYGLRGV
jgi:lipoate-protein ligase B